MNKAAIYSLDTTELMQHIFAHIVFQTFVKPSYSLYLHSRSKWKCSIYQKR